MSDINQLLERHRNIILFDGVCNFCNNSVNLVIRKDKKKQFAFAPLQSEAGIALLNHFGIGREKIDSIVYICNGKAFIKSTAALKIAGKLQFPYPLLKGLMIFPPFLRNPVYDLIARNRYKWFGKKDSCMVPGPGIKEKFISSF